MSCGPSQAIKDVAAQIDALNEQFDNMINESPLGKLNDLKAEAEAELNGLMGKLEAALPDIAFPSADLPFEDLPAIDQMKQVAGLLALGYLQKDAVEAKLDFMKDKYSDLDVDIDNVADLLRSGAADLDDLCKLIPNVETQGINIAVKGTPTSFPDINPVAMVRKGALPELPDLGKVWIDPTVKAKEQADDFLNLELPRFDL